MSPLSFRLRPANASGRFQTASRNRSSPPCWRPSQRNCAGRHRIIVLMLDNAGWHGEDNLKVPEGIRLAFLPPTRPSFRPPRRFGRASTNPSPTSTSPTSTPAKPLSSGNALHWLTIDKPSRPEPAFTGDPKSKIRSDQTETVSFELRQLQPVDSSTCRRLEHAPCLAGKFAIKQDLRQVQDSEYSGSSSGVGKFDLFS